MKAFKSIFIRTISNTSLVRQRSVLLEMHSVPFDSRPLPSRLQLSASALLRCLAVAYLFSFAWRHVLFGLAKTVLH